MEERTKHLTVRILLKDYRLLRKIAEARGEDVSDVVRRALRREFARLSYLDEETKKALGMDR